MLSTAKVYAQVRAARVAQLTISFPLYPMIYLFCGVVLSSGGFICSFKLPDKPSRTNRDHLGGKKCILHAQKFDKSKQ